jgi:hypothetical protein
VSKWELWTADVLPMAPASNPMDNVFQTNAFLFGFMSHGDHRIRAARRFLAGIHTQAGSQLPMRRTPTSE